MNGELETQDITELPESGAGLPPTREAEPITPEPQKPDELKTAMAELASTVTRVAAAQAPKPQPKQYTPEEQAKLWAVYNPEEQDKEFFKKFFRFDENTTPEQLQAAKELFGGMQKGLMQQSITGTHNLIEIALARLHEEYGPIREYVEEARRESTRTRFYGQYESLDDEKFGGLVAAVATSLANRTFENEDAYFKALAEGAAENIKKLIPDFDLGKKTETKPTGKTPKLPRTSAGGGGGAGKGRMDDLKPTGSRNDIDSLELEEIAQS